MDKLITAKLNNIFKNLHTEFYLLSIVSYGTTGHLIRISFDELKASWLYADLAYILHGLERFFSFVQVDEMASDYIIIFVKSNWFEDFNNDN